MMRKTDLPLHTLLPPCRECGSIMVAHGPVIRCLACGFTIAGIVEGRPFRPLQVIRLSQKARTVLRRKAQAVRCPCGEGTLVLAPTCPTCPTCGEQWIDEDTAKRME